MGPLYCQQRLGKLGTHPKQYWTSPPHHIISRARIRLPPVTFEKRVRKVRQHYVLFQSTKLAYPINISDVACIHLFNVRNLRDSFHWILSFFASVTLECSVCHVTTTSFQSEKLGMVLMPRSETVQSNLSLIRVLKDIFIFKKKMAQFH